MPTPRRIALGIDVAVNCMAGSYLDIAIGETYVYTSNVSVGGVAVNLSTAAVTFMAKKHPYYESDSDAVINISTDTGEIVVSGDNSNVVTITMNSTFTAGLDHHDLLFWELAMRTAANSVYSLDHGRMAISHDVIRSPAAP